MVRRMEYYTCKTAEITLLPWVHPEEKKEKEKVRLLKHAFPLFPLYCCSVTKPCLTLCDPMDCSARSFPVHYLLESAQIHVH